MLDQIMQAERNNLDLPVTNIVEEKPKRSSWFFWITIVVVLILAASGGGWYFFYYNNPEIVLQKSWRALTESNSFTIEFELAKQLEGPEVVIKADYQKDQNQYTKGEIQINKINNEVANNLSVRGIYNKNNLYLSPQYSQYLETENQLLALIPELEKMQTYQLLAPVFRGVSWLHISFPSDVVEKVEIGNWETKLKKSLKFRKYDHGFIKNGQIFERVVIGINKTELIGALENLKDYDLEIKVSDLNSLIKTIDATNGWDNDLVEILIDKKTGLVASVSISIPPITPETIKSSLEDETIVGDQQEILWSKLIWDNLKQFEGTTKETSELTKLGLISFSNYEKVALAQEPTNSVEMETVVSTATTELLPLFGQMLIKPTDDVPGKIIPTITQTLVNLQSNGKRLLENNIYGTLMSGEDLGNNFAIKVKFENMGQTVQKIAPIRLQMRSLIQGTAPLSAYVDLTLNPGEAKIISLEYQKLKDYPYTWVYVTNIGSSIVLGSFSK